MKLNLKSGVCFNISTDVNGLNAMLCIHVLHELNIFYDFDDRKKSKIFEENNLEITAISIICYTVLHVLKQISHLTVGFCAIGPGIFLSQFGAEYRPLPNLKMSKNFPKWCISFPIS